MKKQNDRILKEELPRSVNAQYATGGQWRNDQPRQHIKRIMRYHYKPIRMTKFQNTDTPNVAENENRNFHSLLTGIEK